MEYEAKVNKFKEKLAVFYDKLSADCSGIEHNKDKITYLNKIIHEFNTIIELADLFDETEINVDKFKNEIPIIYNNYGWLFDESKTIPMQEDGRFIKEEQQKYMFFELDQLVKSNPNFKIEGIKRIKMQLEFDSEKIFENVAEREYAGEIGFRKDSIRKIKILSSNSDIVRIFEAMRKTEIISSKTTTKQIAELFFTAPNDIISFENKYNSAKSKISNYSHSSNSTELVNFIKLLTEESFKNKELKIEELIQHLERLQKFAM